MDLRQGLRVAHSVVEALQNTELQELVRALTSDGSKDVVGDVVCKGTNPEITKVLSNLDVRLVETLRSWLNSLTEGDFPLSSVVPESSTKISIYADGVFDLMHPGHFNAMRQAGILGDRLVVGVCADDEIVRAKGLLPVYSAEERAELIRGCKWVDEVIVGTPYTVTKNFLDLTNCQYVAHGDDIAIGADGKDCYSEIREMGLLKTFRRTEGISTTNLLFRLLAISEDDTSPKPENLDAENPNLERTGKACGSNSAPNGERSSYYEEPQWIVSSRRLYEFIGKLKPVPAEAKRVYIDGCFDFFNVGHLKLLEEAKKVGTYLVVGIHDDEVIREKKGRSFPIMELMERAMNVLAMRIVDEVVVGAPWIITNFFLEANKIDVVADSSSIDCYRPDDCLSEEERCRKYGAAMSRGILRTMPKSSLRVCDIVDRIRSRKKEILEHGTIRKLKELDHYEEKMLSHSFKSEICAAYEEK